MPKTQTGHRAIISAKYLPLLDAFAAKNDVRYYLNGIYIEPHEEQGAYLCATDGHRMVVIQDAEALADEPMIVQYDPLIIRESKRALLADFDREICELQDDNEAFILSALAPAIDGTFPDWRSLIPTEDFECTAGSVDATLMSAISKAPFASKKAKQTMVYMRNDKPCVVRFPTLPEIFVLVMPMSAPAMQSRPNWLKKKKRTKPPEQNQFDLTATIEKQPKEEPVADAIAKNLANNLKASMRKAGHDVSDVTVEVRR